MVLQKGFTHIYTQQNQQYSMKAIFLHSFEQFIQCKFFWKKQLVNGLDLFKQASSQTCQYK